VHPHLRRIVDRAPALNLQKQDCNHHFINCEMPVHWSINRELPFSLLLFFLYVKSAKIRNKNALLLHILTFFSSTKQRIQVITHYKFWPSDQNYEVYRIHLKCLTGHWYPGQPQKKRLKKEKEDEPTNPSPITNAFFTVLTLF
jgi:hypothetical protein